MILRLGSHFHDNYTLDNVLIPVNTSYKNLGIIVLNNLNFSSDINHLVNVAHARSNLILRAFPFSDVPNRCKLFCTYVRPILEYCSPIRSPYTLVNNDLIENVQRSFSRRLPGLSSFYYLKRLFVTNLPSFEIRRLRYDCVLITL